MMRLPPSFTLFPYTTLFRSFEVADYFKLSAKRARARAQLSAKWGRWSTIRSEEHTSELQSRRDLVCRLLLEKKKKLKAWVSLVLIMPVKSLMFLTLMLPSLV